MRNQVNAQTAHQMRQRQMSHPECFLNEEGLLGQNQPTRKEMISLGGFLSVFQALS